MARADSYEQVPDEAKCLGSDCMMWREVPPIDEGTARLMSQAAVSAASKDGPHGYCGLAGKE
jgi:hypothetical protein